MALPKKRPERWSSESPIQVVQEAPLKQSRAGAWEFAHRQSQWMVRVVFWLLGLILASLQSWSFRHFVTADAIAYLDMSDFVVPGAGWQRIISGVWSPLYPFLIGVGRWILRPSPSGEIAPCHLFNIVIFVFAFACFEFLMRNLLRDSE